MKSLMPWVYLATAVSSQVLYAADGLDAYRQGNYILAAERLTSQSQNDPIVNYYMGLMRLYGYGKLKNDGLALRYMTQAANQGYLPAQQLLARYYLIQKQDAAQALQWFKKAADANDLDSQRYVAAAYLYGFGTKKNEDAARRYYIEAAKKGNAVAQYTLGEHFLESRDSRNKKMGVIWLTKAAAQGNARAQFKLSTLYGSANFVSRDPLKAQQLLESAAESGLYDAQIALAKSYKEGLGVEINPKLAEYWEQMALKNTPQKTPSQDPSVAVANWLSDDKSSRFAKSAYQLGGIYNAWQNPQALKENIYNQSPQMTMIDRQALYKPNFVMVAPSDIPVSDYFDALSATMNDKQATWYYPRYGLDKVIQNVLRDKSFVLAQDPNSPLIYQNSSRHQDTSIKPFDYLAEKTPDWEYQVNFQAVLSHLYGQAILGESAAQFELGQLYQYGIGVSKNIDQAITYLQLAAIQQDVRAEYNLGLLYLQGQTTPVNYQKGIEWMSDAAFKGNSFAQYVLANLYEKGLKAPGGSVIVAPDHQQAMAMYYLASSNHFGKAEYSLADYLVKEKKSGLSVAATQHRQTLIKRLYSGAVKNGVAEAALPLAYYNAMDADPHKQQQAFSIAKKEAEAGNSDAALLLGMMYERGISVPANEVEAMHWYQQASMNPVSAFILGTYYTQGKSLSKDRNKGQELLQQSADAGFSWAKFNVAILKQQAGGDFLTDLDESRQAGNSKAGLLLADYYSQEANNPDNMKQAGDIYHYFAEKGDKDAQLKLGFFYDKGLGGVADKALAAKWYLASAEQGQAMAQYLLGQSYLIGEPGKTPDYAEAKKWFTAAQANYPNASVALGFVYDTVDNDYANAEKNYALAVASGDAIAQYNLGLIYQYGKGIAVNNDKAKALYQLAANQGHAQAMAQLAELSFSKSDGADAQDLAISWYKKAAKAGDRMAMYQLGLLSETGVAMPLDATTALSYYQQAASLGDDKARLAIARMYQFGLGVQKDYQHAIDIYKALATSSNAFAQYQLALIYLGEQAGSSQIADAKLLLKQASDNGNQQARMIMQRLDASQKAQVSFIEPLPMKQTLSASAGQSPELMYLDALNNWNGGDELSSKMILNTIRSQYPQYEPAKRAIDLLNQPLVAGSITG